MNIHNLINQNRFGRYNGNFWSPGQCPVFFSGPNYHSVERKAYGVFCRFANASSVHIWSLDGVFYSEVKMI